MHVQPPLALSPHDPFQRVPGKSNASEIDEPGPLQDLTER